jgi:HEAT repeat protein
LEVPHPPVMNTLQQISEWEGKPKELVIFLAKEAKRDRKSFLQLNEGLKNGSDVQKGVCAEVMEYVTRTNPELALPYVDSIIEFINYKAPRVKWETSRVIANMSQKYPELASKAVNRLLSNAKDSGTVVRWSAAYALTEIAKGNPKLAKNLLPRFSQILRKEKNSGVKNVYLRALKQLKKG